MSNLCHLFHILLVLWTIPDAFGQSATLGGTTFVTGRGFCFGDQQLTQGPPVITCLHTGYTGSPPVGIASASWFINGNPGIATDAVADLYPGRLQVSSLGAAGGQLEVLNVTDSGVTSVACRLVALDTNNNFLFQTNQTAAENIEGAVSSVPAPNIIKLNVTPSGNQVMVSVSRPSGLCTAFTVSGYQYTVYRSADDVPVMTTTSSDNTTTLTGLVSETQYRLEVKAVVEVISQSMVAIRNFITTNGPCATSAPAELIIPLVTCVVVAGVVIIILLVAVAVIVSVLCVVLKRFRTSPPSDSKDSVIYDPVDQDPYSRVKMNKNPVYETTGTAIVLDKNPAFEKAGVEETNILA